MNKPRFEVALTRCFFCGESDQILMNMRSTTLPEGQGQVHQAQGKVVNMEPCSKCKDYMGQGIILITIDNEKSDKGWNKPNGEKHWIPNPYRTGGFFVVTEEGYRKVINDESPDAKVILDFAAKHRWMFIEEAAARLAGLYPAAEGVRSHE